MENGNQDGSRHQKIEPSGPKQNSGYDWIPQRGKQVALDNGLREIQPLGIKIEPELAQQDRLPAPIIQILQNIMAQHQKCGANKYPTQNAAN